MAWAKGTATDFVDFLRILRDYAAGTLVPGGSPNRGLTSGVQVPSGDRWAILSNGGSMASLPSSGFATDGEVYLRGPGAGGSPSDQIIVGLRTFRNSGNNQFSWGMRGYTGFDSGLTFSTLPGASSEVYAAFDDATITINLWVSARRIMALGTVGSTNILVHLGFIQPFATRSQYPYPLLIAGAQSDSTSNFQVNNFGHSCLPDVCNNGAYLRWVDGSWLEWANYGSSSATRASAKSGVVARNFWPNHDPTTHPNGETSNTIGADDFWQNYTATSVRLTPGLTGAYALLPVCLLSSSALVGRIEGLYTVGGLGLVSGDTITDTTVSPNKVYDVFTNTYRSEVADYFAVLRE
jgi:hypothetical protein